jgi:thiosulfate dehydrogenase [quinone] large subunit
MGVTFLYAGIQHLTDPSYFDPSKPGYIGHLISQYAVGSPIHDFLLGIVEPNAVTFGYAVAIGEALIGVAVLIGFLFKIAAFFGLILNFTFFVSATWNAFPYYFGSDIVFVMCWLTLLITGPQIRSSLDGRIAGSRSSPGWLLTRAPTSIARTEDSVKPEETQHHEVDLPKDAKLYPKQVNEVNHAFDRIKQQFVSHEEIQTILEFVRAFVISLGVDRSDSKRILTGLESIVNRDAFESPAR